MAAMTDCIGQRWPKYAKQIQKLGYAELIEHLQIQDWTIVPRSKPLEIITNSAS